MAELYALDLRPWFRGVWRELLPALPQERQTRALACRLDADGARVAGAGWLLQYALEQAGIPAGQQRFTKNPWGKPLLEGRETPQFSLSHAGNWAVCAVSDCPVGVDAELPRCTLEIARRRFHPQEAQWLAQLPTLCQPEALNRMWTAKEAFVKALGRGLTVPLDSFRVTLTPEEAVLEQALSPMPYRLHEYVLEDCRVCLCTTDIRPPLIPVVQKNGI